MICGKVVVAAEPSGLETAEAMRILAADNPRRPLEASGTSGMKAAQNGVPNVSVLDGWWDEGYEGDNGWAIGGREQSPDEAAQDWADAQDLFFADQVARVTAVLSDVDGSTHVALVLVDDPAADLHEEAGRFFYFAPDELEPLDQAREESHP